MNKITPSQRITINFEDVDYPCTKPKIGDVADMELEVARLKADGRGGVTALLVQHLVNCGLPEAVVRKLDPDQMEQVMGILTPTKKNSAR